MVVRLKLRVTKGIKIVTVHGGIDVGFILRININQSIRKTIRKGRRREGVIERITSNIEVTVTEIK